MQIVRLSRVSSAPNPAMARPLTIVHRAHLDSSRIAGCTFTDPSPNGLANWSRPRRAMRASSRSSIPQSETFPMTQRHLLALGLSSVLAAFASTAHADDDRFTLSLGAMQADAESRITGRAEFAGDTLATTTATVSMSATTSCSASKARSVSPSATASTSIMSATTPATMPCWGRRHFRWHYVPGRVARRSGHPLRSGQRDA